MRPAFLFAALVFPALLAAAPVDRPNIIFIMADDMGQEWVSCYGADGIKTPNIDLLAETGLRFNGAYSMPKCTPTRTTLLTGQYPHTTGWVNHWDVPRWSPLNGTTPENAMFDWDYNVTYARVLKSRGYVTGATGKWQLNDFRSHPLAMEKHGFDEWAMWTGAEGASGAHSSLSGRRYWDPYINTRGPGDSTSTSKTYSGQFGPELYTDFVIDFLTRHRNKPMCIYFPLALPHLPTTSTPLNKNRGPVAMIQYIDHSVGRIMSRLDSLGIRNRTIVIFTTDNGTATNWKTTFHGGIPIVGGKGKPTENGSWAPFVVNCPGLVPVGRTNTLSDFTDLFPTFVELAGAKLPEGIELQGVSMAKVLTGEETRGNREWIMTMGGQVAVYQKNVGVRPRKTAATRMMRDLNFKVYVNLNSAKTKFEIKSIHRVDSIPENVEGKNLITSKEPDVVEALAKFNRIIDSLNMPIKDKWPMYGLSNAPDKAEKIIYEPEIDTTDYTGVAFGNGFLNGTETPSDVRLRFRYGQNGLSFEFFRDVPDASLRLFRLNGRLVATIHSGRAAAGQRVLWNKQRLSGNYVVRYSSSLGSWSQLLLAQW